MADRYALALVTGPVGEPLSLQEAKDFLRVDATADDVLIDALIKTARRHVDGKDAWYGVALMTQTWDLFLPHFPCAPDQPYDSLPGIVVPLSPVQSVTSISYVDTAGVPQVLPSTEYVVDTKAEPGRIVPAYGKSWPSTRSSTPNAATVRFVAGYGAAPAVPEDIKTWLKHALAYLYAHREAATLPSAFYWSLANYKVGWGR